MIRTRYFTEDLAAAVGDNPAHHPSQKSVMSQHCRAYHWVRLDSGVIIGYGVLPATNFSQLIQGHPTIALHPSIHEIVALHKHLKNTHKKEHHFHSLARVCGAIPTDTVADVIAKLVGAGHVFLAPDK